MNRAVTTVLFIGIWFLLSVGTFAQIHDPRAIEADPDLAEGPIAPVLDGLGDESIAITTSNPKSQQFFNQGLRLTYGFNHSEALRAFKESARLDLENPMAYWGWALVLGPNLNLPMQEDVEAQAFEAMQNALELKDKATEKEQAYIDALATRYSDDEEADRSELNVAYSQAMEALHQAYPDDNNAATLYAAALMNLSPWNYWQKDGSPRADTPRIVSTLKGVVERDPEHTGAIHYYIHAVEAKQPHEAVDAADTLATLAPGAGHLVHMPSHIYMRVGRYEDSYTQNALAVAADEGYIAQCNAQGVYPLSYYPHNIHFLWAASSMEGRSAIAIEAARKVAANVRLEMIDQFPGVEFFNTIPLLALTRFGRWDEVLAEPQPPENLEFSNAIWHYVRATAYARQGDLDAARAEHEKFTPLRDATDVTFLDSIYYPATMLLSIADELILGEISMAEEKYDDAAAHFRVAVNTQDKLPYTEPPFWYYPTRHALGKALLSAGDAAGAEEVYRADLKQYRRYGWSMYGLIQALKAQDKDTTEIQERFDKVWAQADVTLTASRF